MKNEALTNGNGKSGQEREVHILIADDQRPTRKALAALLALSPQPIKMVGEAADGEQTLRLVEERRPDVVIMDVQMPGMNGLEATRQIKRRWPQVRIVVLTMDASYRTGAIAAGADAFLIKGGPVDALQTALIPEPDPIDVRHTI